MNFSMFELDNPAKLSKLAQKKINFFSKPDEVSIYHYNQIQKNMFHIVYHINDEYQLGTKKLGRQVNLPFREFINCFFFLDNHYFLMEETLDIYKEEILQHIKSHTKVTIANKVFKNVDFERILLRLSGFIKSVEYIDKEDNNQYLDSTSLESFRLLIDDTTIDRLTIIVKDRFISIYKKGKISVDNSDENYLIQFTRDIVDAINNGH